MLYNLPYIQANYKDFIQFVLSQPPERHVGGCSWLDSEVGDWVRDKGIDDTYLFDGHGDPVGLFGPMQDDGSGYYFPMSMYGTECSGNWCDITVSLDEYNYLCYGHIQDYIREHGLMEIEPYDYE